jgi:hypothetical protein
MFSDELRVAVQFRPGFGALGPVPGFMGCLGNAFGLWRRSKELVIDNLEAAEATACDCRGRIHYLDFFVHLEANPPRSVENHGWLAEPFFVMDNVAVRAVPTGDPKRVLKPKGNWMG